MMWRYGWWSPWSVYRPWLPRMWRGTDEWHNPALSVVVPFCGAFHVWFSDYRDGSDGHYDPRERPGCLGCQAIVRDWAER